MKKVTRAEFLLMPKDTIYSKVSFKSEFIYYGLFKKCCNPKEWGNDWLELDLGVDSPFNTNNKENFQIDYTMIVRDGLYENKQMFVIWDKNDKQKLISQLSLLY